MNTLCTCKISRAPCNSVFVYETATGACVGEYPMEQAQHGFKQPEAYTMLCAGAGLQKLNKELAA